MRNLKTFCLLSSVTIFFFLVLSGCARSEALNHGVKGHEYYEAGQFSEAITEFTKAIELDSYSEAGYLGRANAYYQLGQWEKAIEDFERLLEIYPKTHSVGSNYVKRGIAYYQLGKFEEAIIDLDKAIETELETPSELHEAILTEAYKHRGHAYLELGHNDQARQDFEAMLTLDPNYPEADDLKKLVELLSTPNLPSALCFWFADTQVLRAERISGLTKFISFFQTRAAEDLASLEQADLDELTVILEEYIPYERDFINKWEELGSIRGGEIFWGKELEAEKKKLSAFEKMLDGIADASDTLFNAGRDEVLQAIQIGRESEAAMIEIRAKCVDETN